MANKPYRKTPEEFLQQAQSEEQAATKGYLKIFLGYASGVGKSVRMFEEARRRWDRGQDIVIGAVQPVVPESLEPVLRAFEMVPLKNGIEVDVETLIRRHPTVCVIDGLAYKNPAGARNPARWMDVQELIEAGIKVIGSINIQYVAELQERVEVLTGKHVSDSVPVSFIKSADEIEIIDAPAESLKGPTANEGKRHEALSKLRELALLLAADVVDYQLEEYLARHGIQHRLGTQERILLCITPRANAREMITTGRTIAERFRGELMAAYVSQPEMSTRDREALEEKLEMARAAGAVVEVLEGEDPVDTILDFARGRGITQIFIGHTQRSGMWAGIWGNPVEKLIRKSEGMDVRVFPQ